MELLPATERLLKLAVKSNFNSISSCVHTCCVYFADTEPFVMASLVLFVLSLVLQHARRSAQICRS